MKETGTESQTPEQLMQLLDGELAARRSQRAASSRNRAMLLVGGLLFIIIIAGGALLVLEQMLSDLRSENHVVKVVPAETH